MKGILMLSMLLALGLVGCGEHSVSPEKSVDQIISEYPDASQTINEGLSLLQNDNLLTNGKQPLPLVSAGGVTYAYGVLSWHDNIEGDEDWMAVFYLPYNPGTVAFYGRVHVIGVWQNFSPPWIRLYDVRWTAQGFRVMIFMGSKVTIPCGTSPGSYRLQY